MQKYRNSMKDGIKLDIIFVNYKCQTHVSHIFRFGLLFLIPLQQKTSFRKVYDDNEER